MAEKRRRRANDSQYGGTHYLGMPIQPWDFITANNLTFLEGSVVKYVARWRQKGGIEDLRKAQHFLEKLIEVETEQLRQLELKPEKKR